MVNDKRKPDGRRPRQHNGKTRHVTQTLRCMLRYVLRQEIRTKQSTRIGSLNGGVTLFHNKLNTSRHMTTVAGLYQVTFFNCTLQILNPVKTAIGL